MDPDLRTSLLSDYLKAKGVTQFSAVFCFSTTMWVHLNHGDNGLRAFLAIIYQISRLAVIEPQPWKCYKAAVKRMKMSDERFPFYDELKIRESVEGDIERMFLEFGGVRKVGETGRTKWNRRTLFLLQDEG